MSKTFKYGIFALVLGSLATFSSLVAAPDQLKSLSIEDLLGMEVITPGKKEERLFNSTAAIDVISDEEIHRSGFTSIPESLRLAAGIHVGRDENGSWTISSRGFTSEQGNKMQVVIDGRNVYTPLYSGVFWDVQGVFMPDLERIEVVRGPGATLWGANAVNGVINILTKEASETQGGLLYAGTGNVESGFGGMRYGGEINDTTHFRVYAKGFEQDAMERLDGSEVDDQYQLWQQGFRIDGRPSGTIHWTFQGDIYTGETTTYYAENNVDGGNLLGRFDIEFDRSSLSIQTYYDRVEREVGGSFGETRDTLDLEIQYQVQVAERHDIITGINLRSSSDETIMSSNVDFVPASKTINLWSAFLQDEITLIEDTLSATIGAKLEENSYSDTEFQPNLRIGWTPHKKHFFWGAISRAVRIPTRLDHDVVASFGARDPFGNPFPLVLGNPDIQSEELVAFELGHRFAISENLTVELSLFLNQYDNLRIPEPSENPIFPPYPLIYQNKMEAESIGGEFVLRMNVSEKWNFSLKYSYLDLDLSFDEGSRAGLNEASLESNSPEHILTAQNLFEVTDDVFFDSTLRYVSELKNPHVDDYLELDLRLGWKITDECELELIGHNLLHDNHPEFNAIDASPLGVRRSIFARVTFRY